MYSNKTKKQIARPFVKGFFFIVFGAGFMLLLGFIVMWLWNAILPNAVNANPIKYWEAIGLLILSRILFGSFWFDKQRHKQRKRKRVFWREKWMNMSEEERITFKAKWKDKCRTKIDTGKEEE